MSRMHLETKRLLVASKEFVRNLPRTITIIRHKYIENIHLNVEDKYYTVDLTA